MPSEKQKKFKFKRPKVQVLTILDDLKKSYRRNQRTWKRLLEQVPPDGD